MGNKIAIVTLAVAVLIAIFNMDVMPQAIKSYRNYDPNAIVIKEMDYAIISRMFRDNRKTAIESYNGKYYWIDATIEDMPSDITTDNVMVQMYNKDSGTYFDAKFSEVEPLKTLSKGDEITFSGKCIDGSFEDCKLKIEE